VVLQLLAMGISNVADFDFMDKPSPEVGCFVNSFFVIYLLASLNYAEF